jgi:4-hydroxy 2-oxovalerate aldolase
MSEIRTVEIHDSTLRDGNHAVRQSIDHETVRSHCAMANNAGLASVEVGHGNGLGASSYQVGFAKLNDAEALATARQSLQNTKLVVHVIPGCALYERDIAPAIDKGVDIFRVGVHCTEADLTECFIQNITQSGKLAYGALMMSHMASIDRLLIEAEKMYSYGAAAVCIYDSAGVYDQMRVESIITKLKNEFGRKVGFHGHNNLGLAVANSLTAIDCGADIIDAAICGFGAGAGNTQLEVLASILDKRNYNTGIKLPELFELAAHASSTYAKNKPYPSALSIATAINGLFSGFAPHIEKAAKLHSIDAFELMKILGKKGVVAGQEDLIYTTASNLAHDQSPKDNHPGS